MYKQAEIVEPTYSAVYNDAHWARDAWHEGTGQWLGITSPILLASGKMINLNSPIGLEHSIRSLELQPNQERIIHTEPEKSCDAPAPESQPQAEPAPAPQIVALLRQGKDLRYDHDR